MLEEFSVIWQRQDCAYYEVLLTTLHFYGNRGVSKDRFRPCLTSRRQKVEVKSPNRDQIFFSLTGAYGNNTFPKQQF
jgi:hypothetical protein